MFHKAVDLKLLDGTALEVTFQDGLVKRYDMSALFPKYPQLRALTDRELFLRGRLVGSYGVVWNDDLDVETETVYEDGATVREEKLALHPASSRAVAAARAAAGLSQKQLADLCGIDQSDISKIERGFANPSVATLERIAAALNAELSISISAPSDPSGITREGALRAFDGLRREASARGLGSMTLGEINAEIDRARREAEN